MIPERPSRARQHAAYAAVALSVIVTAYASGVRFGSLFDREGSHNAWAILRGFLHPDTSHEFVWRVVKLSLESLLIGILGTTLAVAIGLALALVAIRVPQLEDIYAARPRFAIAGETVRHVVKSLLALFRSIPEIVWAFMFVRVIGLGPGPAVLAIAITTGGVFGKLFSELAEAVEPESIRALRRIGVSRFGILLYGVLPQVWRQWAGYAFYRLECSVRSASILGVVGAGGLGSEIALSIRYFQYEKLATALLAILVFVVAIEWLSTVLRRASFKWTLAFVLAGTVGAVAYLDIPWSELTLSDFIPGWLLKSGGIATWTLVKQAVWQAAKTVAMAWCATWAAAAVALVLSPLTTRYLTHRKHNERLRGRFGVDRAASWLLAVGTRLFTQACRAAPELALALVFILWVGPGSYAGVLAIFVHTIGVITRLFSDVYEEIDQDVVASLENGGASRLAMWLYGVFPQAAPRLLAFTLYRFEVNVRMTAMVGFVGAGGIGDSIDTAISLFHGHDLVVLLAVLLALVIGLDAIGDRVRARLLRGRFVRAPGMPPRGASTVLQAQQKRRRYRRYARAKRVLLRPRGMDRFARGTIRSVSAAGMFLETELVLPRDTVVELALRAASPGGPQTESDNRPDPGSICLGRVVYTRDDEVPGMGVELVDEMPQELMVKVD